MDKKLGSVSDKRDEFNVPAGTAKSRNQQAQGGTYSIMGGCVKLGFLAHRGLS